MANNYGFCLILFSTFSCIHSINFDITDLKQCITGKHHTIDVSLKTRKTNRTQEHNWNVTFHEDLGNDNEYEIKISKVLPKAMIPLGKQQGKGSCNAFFQYGGIAAAEVTKRMKIGDSCPLHKGKYHLDWYALNYDSIPLLKMVPKGKFHLKFYAHNKKEDIICVEFKVEKIN